MESIHNVLNNPTDRHMDCRLNRPHNLLILTKEVIIISIKIALAFNSTTHMEKNYTKLIHTFDRDTFLATPSTPKIKNST